MRNLKRSLMAVILTLSVCVISGCTPSLSVGPQVRTEYVIVHPGKPIQVLENAKVKGRAMDDTGAAVEQKIGGWVMMPPEHWEAVKRELEK